MTIIQDEEIKLFVFSCSLSAAAKFVFHNLLSASSE